jgi:hypothetical protein
MLAKKTVVDQQYTYDAFKTADKLIGDNLETVFNDETSCNNAIDQRLDSAKQLSVLTGANLNYLAVDVTTKLFIYQVQNNLKKFKENTQDTMKSCIKDALERMTQIDILSTGSENYNSTHHDMEWYILSSGVDKYILGELEAKKTYYSNKKQTAQKVKDVLCK